MAIGRSGKIEQGLHPIWGPGPELNRIIPFGEPNLILATS